MQGQVSGTGDGLFQARPWVSSQSSHLSELSPKACGHPPAEPHARPFWQARWPWKSSYPGQQVQVYEVQPFMTHKGLPPHQAALLHPGVRPWVPWATLALGWWREQSSLCPGKHLLLSKMLHLFCYKSDAQPQHCVPMAPAPVMLMAKSCSSWRGSRVWSPTNDSLSGRVNTRRYWVVLLLNKRCTLFYSNYI